MTTTTTTTPIETFDDEYDDYYDEDDGRSKWDVNERKDIEDTYGPSFERIKEKYNYPSDSSFESAFVGKISVMIVKEGTQKRKQQPTSPTTIDGDSGDRAAKRLKVTLASIPEEQQQQQQTQQPQPPKHKCTACGGDGWWCRGCGGSSKIDGMKASGMTAEEADGIYEAQFDGCDKPFVPCYVCNRDGTKKEVKKDYRVGLNDFWKKQ